MSLCSEQPSKSSRIAMMLLALSIGMGLGRSLEEWPGPLWSSGLSLALAVAALALYVKAAR